MKGLFLSLLLVGTLNAQVSISNGKITKAIFTNAPAVVIVDSTWLTLNLAGTARANFTGNLGGKFTVNTTITITALGSYTFAGSTQTHNIGIWVDGSPATPIAQVSLNKNGLPVGINYQNLVTPLVLAPGNYIMAEQETSGGDTWYNDNTLISTTGIATITTSGFNTSSTFSCPDTFQNPGVNFFIPLSFKYH